VQRDEDVGFALDVEEIVFHAGFGRVSLFVTL
jgi:hypothetical protein